jgi:hypothetical protein
MNVAINAASLVNIAVRTMLKQKSLDLIMRPHLRSVSWLGHRAFHRIEPHDWRTVSGGAA